MPPSKKEGPSSITVKPGLLEGSMSQEDASVASRIVQHMLACLALCQTAQHIDPALDAALEVGPENDAWYTCLHKDAPGDRRVLEAMEQLRWVRCGETNDMMSKWAVTAHGSRTV